MSKLEIVGGKPIEKGCPFAWGMAFQQVPGINPTPVFIQSQCVREACKAWRETGLSETDGNGAAVPIFDCHALRLGRPLV